MPLFNVPKRAGREQDSAIAKKTNAKIRSAATVKGSGLLGQINQIKAMVEKNLGNNELKTGVKVIHRNDSNYDEALKQIVDTIIAIDAMSDRDHQKLRRAAKSTSKLATWEHFMPHYLHAYEIALEKALSRIK